MPWWVTQSIWRSVSRRSSESRRTAWMPGITSVPLPVVILKPRLCSRPLVRWARPEMISASFGSPIRHMLRNIPTTMMRTRTMRIATAMMAPPAIDRRPDMKSSPCPSGRADNDGARREVLDHDDAGALGDRHVRVRGVRVERFAPTPNRHHDLAQAARADDARDPADEPDHPVVKHRSHHSSTNRPRWEAPWVATLRGQGVAVGELVRGAEAAAGEAVAGALTVGVGLVTRAAGFGDWLPRTRATGTMMTPASTVRTKVTAPHSRRRKDRSTGGRF